MVSAIPHSDELIDQILDSIEASWSKPKTKSKPMPPAVSDHVVIFHTRGRATPGTARVWIFRLPAHDLVVATAFPHRPERGPSIHTGVEGLAATIVRDYGITPGRLILLARWQPHGRERDQLDHFQFGSWRQIADEWWPSNPFATRLNREEIRTRFGFALPSSSKLDGLNSDPSTLAQADRIDY
jgi:hypothetical protein